jgi:hypothetical protein
VKEMLLLGREGGREGGRERERERESSSIVGPVVKVDPLYNHTPWHVLTLTEMI